MEHVYNGRFSPESLATRFGLPLAAVRTYLASLSLHIRHVMDFGLLLRVPEEQLVVHDQSKWSDAEFPAYVRKFGAGIDDPTDFEPALLHHFHANPHHWQSWLIPHSAKVTPVEMPEHFVREMVADWMGAGAAYNGPNNDPQRWLNDNAGRMLFHPQSEQKLRIVLSEIGMRWPR